MDELRPVSWPEGGGVLLGWHRPAGDQRSRLFLQILSRRRIVIRFRHLIDKANRAGAVVYTVDARGLVYLEPEQLAPSGYPNRGCCSLPKIREASPP
jgi:alpha-beta hydrolase superfamily lysophospholipase